MKKKTVLVLVALMAVFALMLTGCGKEKAEEAPAPTAAEVLPTESSPLGLASWELTTSTWSSPNGATVHLSAVPNAHSKDQYAVFSVRLEGDDVENIPCEWNGKSYTASADGTLVFTPGEATEGVGYDDVQNKGLLWYLFFGVDKVIYPPLIFLGIEIELGLTYFILESARRIGLCVRYMLICTYKVLNRIAEHLSAL